MTTDALQRLAEQVRRELELFDYPPREWVKPRLHDGQPVTDVVIVGGGQNGIGTASALKLARVPNVLVLDENPAGREGPWITYARMHTLRTIKTLPGPALKVHALAFRTWYEAQHGAAAFDDMLRIPKHLWADWLAWMRRTLGIAKQNDTRLEAIEPMEGLLRLTVRSVASPASAGDGFGTRHLWCRKVVLTTGTGGAGGRNLPAFTRQLARTRWAHTAEAIDFASLQGQDVAVLGAGASAFDNAATALEAGATRVDLYMRRSKMPEMNSARWMEFEGLYRHFTEMSDANRWRFMRKVFASPMPPPPDTLLRCTAFPNFHLHFDAGWESAVMRADGRIAIHTREGEHTADFAILGTGFVADLARRPELAAVLPHVAFWGDRFMPPRGEESAAIAAYPYLGPGFELTERVPGTQAALADIHLFNGAALPSVGPVGTGINGMPHGVERVVRGITRDLFLRDQDAFVDDFLAYDVSEATLAVPASSTSVPTPSP